MDMYSMVQRKGLRTALSRMMNARSAKLEERLIIVVVVSVRDIEMVKDRMVLSFICSFFFLPPFPHSFCSRTPSAAPRPQTSRLSHAVRARSCCSRRGQPEKRNNPARQREECAAYFWDAEACQQFCGMASHEGWYEISPGKKRALFPIGPSVRDTAIQPNSTARVLPRPIQAVRGARAVVDADGRRSCSIVHDRSKTWRGVAAHSVDGIWTAMMCCRRYGVIGHAQRCLGHAQRCLKPTMVAQRLQ